jgi:hypothetical protein
LAALPSPSVSGALLAISFLPSGFRNGIWYDSSLSVLLLLLLLLLLMLLSLIGTAVPLIGVTSLLPQAWKEEATRFPCK